SNALSQLDSSRLEVLTDRQSGSRALTPAIYPVHNRQERSQDSPMLSLQGPPWEFLRIPTRGLEPPQNHTSPPWIGGPRFQGNEFWNPWRCAADAFLLVHSRQ